MSILTREDLLSMMGPLPPDADAHVAAHLAHLTCDLCNREVERAAVLGSWYKQIACKQCLSAALAELGGP